MDYTKAYELKQQGIELKEIMKQLNISMAYKAFQRGLLRYENTLDNKPTVDIKGEILKIINKEHGIKELSEKLNSSERVINAYIEDLKELGYNITDIEGKFKLSKDIILTDNKHEEDWQGDKIIKFGIVSDTHLCNKWQQLTFLNSLYDIFQHEGINTVYHAGDLSDGYYKTRPSHIYELIPGLAGADAQAEYIIDKYPRRKGIVTKFITGNHDDTHIMNGGVNIGKIIARQREDMIYLGMNNAKINLTPNCILELNHPGDGAAYALSYTLQKLIDSMSGGDKPNILINGHHHKYMNLFYRNIHAFEAGTLEAQTPFMRAKKIAAHVGGIIVEVHVDKEGTVTRCKGEFIPLYKPLENDF